MKNKGIDKVLLTGANGLLGANTARALLKMGYQIKAIVRPNADISTIMELPIEIFYGSILNLADLEQAMAGCQAIVHIAAKTHQAPSRLKFFWKANVTATSYLIELAKRKKAKRFIFISTCNTIQAGTRSQAAKESNPFPIWMRRSGYAYSKYIAENLVLDAVKSSQLPAVILNPAFMLGSYDCKPSSGQIFNWMKKQLIVCPSGGKSFIHVQDAAIAVANALSIGKIGQRYILSHKSMSYKEFFNKAALFSQHKHFILVLPKPALLLFGLIGSVLNRIGFSKFALNYTNARMLAMDNVYSPNKAIKDLGLPQTSIKEAIRDAKEWLGI